MDTQHRPMSNERGSPNIETELRVPVVSVPNPKRSVPVSILSMTEEDHSSPFADDSYVVGNSRSIRSPILELNPSQDVAKPHMPSQTTSRTPEIFELGNQSSLLGSGIPLDQRSASRGVIGSARKVKSSNSVMEELGLGATQTNSTSGLGSDLNITGDGSLLSLLDGSQPTLLSGYIGRQDTAGMTPDGGWSRAPLLSPVGRPSSTPLIGAGATSGLGLLGSTLGGGLAGDLHLSDGGGADNRVGSSFGSLAGLTSQLGAASVQDPFSQRPLSTAVKAVSPQAEAGLGMSRGNSRAAAPLFADAPAPDQWLAGMSVGQTREQAIRGSLPLSGTVSAPPLLSMYTHGYGSSINNHSAFGAQQAATAIERFDPLAARYLSREQFSALPLQTQVESLQPRLSTQPKQLIGRTPSPDVATVPRGSEAVQREQSPQPQSTALAGPRLGDAESVEGLVLRSCRDILVGAADRSLKAVELANTLRARVGTEALARVRERWGGLLSLLEKHTSTFRVDRIPKNDKVTLLLGPGEGGLPASQAVEQAVGRAHPSSSSVASEAGAAHAGSGGNNSSTATRCLHVGNVPANMTEAQLVREFEKFGQIDGLKMVSQRNGARRFAFVTFRTVEQASAARHALSKIHPWKSAISFAHKDFGGASAVGADGSSRGAGGQASSNPHHPVAYPMSTAPRGLYGAGGQGYQQQHMMSPIPAGMPYSPYMPMNMGMGMGMGPAGAMPYGQSPTLYWMPPPVGGGGHPGLPVDAQQVPLQGKPSAVAGVESTCPVLQRLCDDTYVPTQPWPVDQARDQPYCAAVVAQLLQFGGFTTVSKLRGFLRNRVSATDNIKSVPLKAMLLAYPQHFALDGNYVYLAGAAAGQVPQGFAGGLQPGV